MILIGDVLQINTTYVTGTLATNPTKTIRKTLQTLGFLGNKYLDVTATGVLSSGEFYVQGIPQNADGSSNTSSLVYNKGKGAVYYFNTQSQMDNTFSAFNIANASIQAVMAVQDAQKATLLAITDVVGTATSMADTGEIVIDVYTKSDVSQLIPTTLGGVPIRMIQTGEFKIPLALGNSGKQGISPVAKPDKPPGKGGGGGKKVDASVKFTRPVPIGVSTSLAIGACLAGTIGVRMTKGDGLTVILSNNHVFAGPNTQPIGTNILQPGLFDTDCVADPDVLGQLLDFESISNISPNTMDAAIASTTTLLVDNSTPTDGYGIPKSAITKPTLNQSVQKYGRTTELTAGVITGINVTVLVDYGGTLGVVTFEDQIIVEARKSFLRAGDSGSLLITDQGHPVGLLFAANQRGTLAVANRIDLILTRFDATIDGI